MTDFAGMTAAELRAKSAASYQEKEDSFQRCDTDGFLSQWASGLTGELYRTQAEIVEAGGVFWFWGLYDGDRRVPAKMFTKTFNYHPVTSWVLRDDADAEKFGRRFIPAGDNSRIQKKLGLSERKELAPAEAFMDGRGTGLSGSAWVSVRRTGCQWGTDTVLQKEGE